MNIEQIKKVLHGSINFLLALFKVVAMTGGAVFNVKKFVELLTDVKDGLDTVSGKSAASIAALATALTTIVVRFFNMIREKPPAHSHEQPIVTEHESSLHVPSSHRCISRFAKINATIYAGYSGLSGYLGAFTLVALIESLWNEITQLTPERPGEQSEEQISRVILLNLFAITVALANTISFKKYNYERYCVYLDDMYKGDWKKYKWPVFTLASVNVVIGAAIANLSNRRAADLLNEKILLRMSDKLHISEQGTIIFSMVGVTTGLMVNTIMSIPATSRLWKKLHDHSLHEDLTKYAETLPRWYKMRFLVYFVLFLDAIQSGICGTTAAFAYALREYFKVDPHSSSVVIGSFIPAILAMLNAFALNKEGYRTETEARYKHAIRINHLVPQQVTHGYQPLNDANDDLPIIVEVPSSSEESDDISTQINQTSQDQITCSAMNENTIVPEDNGNNDNQVTLLQKHTLFNQKDNKVSDVWKEMPMRRCVLL